MKYQITETNPENDRTLVVAETETEIEAYKKLNEAISLARTLTFTPSTVSRIINGQAVVRFEIEHVQFERIFVIEEEQA